MVPLNNTQFHVTYLEYIYYLQKYTYMLQALPK